MKTEKDVKKFCSLLSKSESKGFDNYGFALKVGFDLKVRILT